tara:strand:+ start:176 stop:829 length:654 start_codon:yes stop_codon:yes gene_type:complete
MGHNIKTCPHKKSDEHIKCTQIDKNVNKNIINRGTGAGGSNTNKNGLSYEELTEINDSDRYITKDTIKIKNKKISQVEIDGKLFIKVIKGELKLYMMHSNKFNIDSEKSLQPDECYIDETNKVINIIEKKFQQSSGSVDEKIQTGAFKRWFYKEQYPEYTIKYCYCLSDWFKQKRYNPEFRYYKNHNIKVFYGSDDLYVDKLLDWILVNPTIIEEEE